MLRSGPHPRFYAAEELRRHAKIGGDQVLRYPVLQLRVFLLEAEVPLFDLRAEYVEEALILADDRLLIEHYEIAVEGRYVFQ